MVGVKIAVCAVMGKQGYVLFIVEGTRGSGRYKTGENKQIQKFLLLMKCSEIRCSFKLFSQHFTVEILF